MSPVTMAAVRGSVQFGTESARTAQQLRRTFSAAGVPNMGHRVFRSTVLTPSRFADRAEAAAIAAGFSVQAVLVGDVA